MQDEAPRSEYCDGLLRGPAKGRGAGLNPGNRFERVRLHVLGEAWDERAREAAEDRTAGGSLEPGPTFGQEGETRGAWTERELPRAGTGSLPGSEQVVTRVIADASRSIINRVDACASPDIPFEWSVNPYRGCEHGCIYCYARPTHEWLGMSCGLDFETKIMAKFDAPKLLRRELARAWWKGDPIAMCGVTDAYQPLEAECRITRGCLEVMSEFGQSVGIVTKNRLVVRDLDVLSAMAKRGLVHVMVSLSTLDARLAGKLEPRASSPKHRLEAMQKLSEAGVPVGIMTAPIIPGLTDRELPGVMRAAAEAGAKSAGYVLLRLPHQIKELFLDWLAREYPQRAKKVESLIRQTRQGMLYQSQPGIRMRGQGEVATQIGRVFKLFRARYGLDKGLPALNTRRFARPLKTDHQMGLFE